MSDKAEKTEKMPDASEESVGVNEQNANQAGDSQEPKNVQELTNYIQSMLQQMQDRFQTMSDQVKLPLIESRKSVLIQKNDFRSFRG